MTHAASEGISAVSLRIPAQPQYLVFGRLVLAGLSRVQAIDPETLADLKLAVTEACSSVVRSAGERSLGEIAIRYEIGERHVTVEVTDDGSGEEQELLEGEAAGLDESALGFALIQAVVDELDIGARPEGRGTRLRFSKSLP